MPPTRTRWSGVLTRKKWVVIAESGQAEHVGDTVDTVDTVNTVNTVNKANLTDVPNTV
jgi:hypothetical protein